MSPSLRLPFSYGWRLPAHLYIYWYSCVAVYVTTATHRRTTTQQQVSAAAGAFAPGFLPPGGHAISACACHDHAHATASAVDLLPSTCACGVWLYNTRVVFRPRVNMNAREILRYQCIYDNKASSSHTTIVAVLCVALRLLLLLLFQSYPALTCT